MLYLAISLILGFSSLVGFRLYRNQRPIEPEKIQGSTVNLIAALGDNFVPWAEHVISCEDLSCPCWGNAGANAREIVTAMESGLLFLEGSSDEDVSFVLQKIHSHVRPKKPNYSDRHAKTRTELEAVALLMGKVARKTGFSSRQLATMPRLRAGRSLSEI